MSTEFQRTCPSCGSELSGTMQFCPVCMLRKALPGGAESGESSAAEVAVDPANDEPEQTHNLRARARRAAAAAAARAAMAPSLTTS